MIQKGTITENDSKEIKSRIKTTTSLKDLSSCDFIVEAATEHTETKLKIFQGEFFFFKKNLQNSPRMQKKMRVFHFFELISISFGNQHFLHFNYKISTSHFTTRSSYWNAFHESSSCNETC
jgi:hypothetical protein